MKSIATTYYEALVNDKNTKRLEQVLSADFVLHTTLTKWPIVQRKVYLSGIQLLHFDRQLQRIELVAADFRESLEQNTLQLTLSTIQHKRGERPKKYTSYLKMSFALENSQVKIRSIFERYESVDIHQCPRCEASCYRTDSFTESLFAQSL